MHKPLIKNAVSLEAGLKLINASGTEKNFQDQIIEYARMRHWLAAHSWDYRRSEPGLYDLVMVRAPRFIVAEVKREGAKLRKARFAPRTGRLLPGQNEWAEAAKGCPGVEYYLWMPHDWPEIVKVLQ